MPTLKLLRTTRSQHSRSPSRLQQFENLAIQLKFFNEPYNFIVDTGAHKTCISQKLFNRLIASQNHFDPEVLYSSIKIQKYHGCGGVETSQRIALKINFLGKIILAVTIGHFLDEWQKKNISGFDGLLGQDVLAQFDKVTIDYLKGEISFT